jgi:hypothetical protein
MALDIEYLRKLWREIQGSVLVDSTARPVRSTAAADPRNPLFSLLL